MSLIMIIGIIIAQNFQTSLKLLHSFITVSIGLAITLAFNVKIVNACIYLVSVSYV